MRLAPQARTFGERKYIEYKLASILDGYVATVDAPAIAFTPELMSVFPDAVVIATTRDEEGWWRSMDFMNGLMANKYIPWLVLWIPKVGYYRQWKAAFGKVAQWRYGETRVERNMLKKQEEHLRAVVPKDKLFWFDVKDGWGPLCEILGVPVPDVDFPHNNSKADAQQSYRDAVSAGLFCWAIVIIMTGVGLWATWALGRGLYRLQADMFR
jgi:hypothetical protein